jgi:membrane-associated phospholipid phosphatase
MIVYVTYTKNMDGSYPLLLALTLAALVIMSMFFGRVYYGVHTFVDTMGGLLLSLTTFIVILRLISLPPLLIQLVILAQLIPER